MALPDALPVNHRLALLLFLPPSFPFPEPGEGGREEGGNLPLYPCGGWQHTVPQDERPGEDAKEEHVGSDIVQEE
eukprot:evm.model.NODE_38951_length_3139_cov_2.099076.1